MTNLENISFHPLYVNPYYLELMNASFLRMPDEEGIAFLKEVRDLRGELTDQEILLLLRNYWRASKVGAWIIGLNKIYELEPFLIEELESLPTYPEHIIHALVLMNSPEGKKALIRYCQNTLQVSLPMFREAKFYRATDYFHRANLDLALTALKYFDLQNKTDLLAQSTTKNSVWMEIQHHLSAAINAKNYQQIKRGIEAIKGLPNISEVDCDHLTRVVRMANHLDNFAEG